METAAKKGLTGNQIKWIAILTMLIDHIAWAFVPFGTAAGQSMHVIGRITAPVMCFFIAEGYAHTRNVGKYALRLGVFALISQIPFTYFETGHLQFLSPGNGSESFNVIYTLLLSLAAVWAWDSIQRKGLRVLAVAGLCFLAMPGDWMFIDVIFALVFWVNRDRFRDQAAWFSVFAACTVIFCCVGTAIAGGHFYSQLFQAGLFLCLPVLSRYNGERGGTPNSKWAFYIFYPAHLLVLGFLKYGF